MTEDEKLLVYWINEREAIRALREDGQPKPWTQDTVLQNYRFCNVRREDDRVTRWMRESWLTDKPHRWVLARMFNLPSHLAELLDHQVRDQPGVSKERRARGEKLFNGAYLITTCGVKMDKVDYVYRVVEEASQLDFTGCDTLAGYSATLRSVNGLGSFLAAQVVADLKNTLGHTLCNAPDWWTWCAPGPGSIRGLKWALGGLTTPPRQFLQQATALHERIADKIPKLHMQDFQNCLCEYDKYRRALSGGRPKQRYPGAG